MARNVKRSDVTDQVLALVKRTMDGLILIGPASVNADGHRPLVSKIGVATGIVATSAGALMLAKRGNSSAFYAVGASTAAIGGTSLALGVRAMRRRSATLSPVFTAGAKPTAGVALSLTY